MQEIFANFANIHDIDGSRDVMVENTMSKQKLSVPVKVMVFRKSLKPVNFKGFTSIREFKYHVPWALVPLNLTE